MGTAGECSDEERLAAGRARSLYCGRAALVLRGHRDNRREGFGQLECGGVTMQRLALAIADIDGWLGTTGRPYPIWNNGWVSDGGLRWDYPLVSSEQARALNEVSKLTAQSLAGGPFVSMKDYELAMRGAYVARASHLDAATWQLGYQILVEPDGMSKLERQRERTFRRTRRLASQLGLTAYKWRDISSTSFGAIVVAPLATQYDILRTERTAGNDYYRPTQKIIEVLLSLDQNYGVIISGASDTSLEFWFKRAPKGRRAQEVGERLLQLAPNIHEAPTDFHSCVALWWG